MFCGADQVQPAESPSGTECEPPPSDIISPLLPPQSSATPWLSSTRVMEDDQPPKASPIGCGLEPKSLQDRTS